MKSKPSLDPARWMTIDIPTEEGLTQEERRLVERGEPWPIRIHKETLSEAQMRCIDLLVKTLAERWKR